jgi:branched-chain amino acid transport system substrate-binding protein
VKKFARVFLTLVCVLLFTAAAGAETIKLGFNIPMTATFPKW